MLLSSGRENSTTVAVPRWPLLQQPVRPPNSYLVRVDFYAFRGCVAARIGQQHSGAVSRKPSGLGFAVDTWVEMETGRRVPVSSEADHKGLMKSARRGLYLSCKHNEIVSEDVTADAAAVGLERAVQTTSQFEAALEE